MPCNEEANFEMKKWLKRKSWETEKTRESWEHDVVEE